MQLLTLVNDRKIAKENIEFVVKIEAVLDNFTSVDGCGIIGEKPMSWAAQELEGADLGDKRRNRRLIKVVEDLAMQPNESVPQASRDTAAMQGIYEFWANPRIRGSVTEAAARGKLNRIVYKSRGGYE